MAKTVSDNLTITATQASDALKTAFKVKRPVFIWGPPGIGKSELVQSVINSMGGLVIDLRMAQMEPTDIRGIPFFNKELNKMDWAPPIDLPDEETASQYPIIGLFLDEMNSAPAAVQAAGYQLILNRRLGKYRLPDNVVIIAAGNRDSDKGVTYRMPLPLANRFIHLEMRADFTTWQHWAIDKGIHKDVVGYLSFAKQDLMDFDPKAASRAFPTPRSWVFVSDLLKDETVNRDTLYNLIAGSIGEGLAVKFMAHHKIASKLPNPLDILEGKEKTLQVKEISAMYSLIISMCYELRDAVENKHVDKKKFHSMMENFFQFSLDNFEAELVVMGAKIAVQKYKLPVDFTQLGPAYELFFNKYSKYIIESN